MAMVKDVESIPASRKRVYGLVLMSLSGLFITIANTLVQFLHLHSKVEIHALTILFSRSFVVLLITSVFMVAGKVNPIPSLRGVLCLTALGLSGVLSILFIFMALSKIPIGDTTVLQFTAPVFTAVLASVVLHQRCSLLDVLCGMTSFGGVLVMIRPTIIFGKQDDDSREICECLIEESRITTITSTIEYTHGVLYALSGAIFLAIFYVLNKVSSQHGDIILNIFYSGLVGALLPNIINFLANSSLKFSNKWDIWLLLLLIGILSFVHLMFIVEALQLEDAGPASLVRNADCVYAFILQYTFLGLVPHLLTLLGAVIVTASTTAMGIFRYINAKREERESMSEQRNN